MKRFYKNAAVLEIDGGYTVQLDGRSIKTPAKAALTTASAALAQAIADEWQSQGDRVEPASMPMMTLASTTIDRVIPNQAEIVSIIAAYGESDLLCYRATSDQQDLADKQKEGWQPWLDWAMQQLDAPLNVTEGILHVAQGDDSLHALKNAVAGYGAFELAALHEVTTLTGSLVLGLAVLQGELPGEEAFRLAHIDEEHQAALWGRDEEAEARLERRKGELLNAVEFLRLFRAG